MGVVGSAVGVSRNAWVSPSALVPTATIWPASSMPVASTSVQPFTGASGSILIIPLAFVYKNAHSLLSANVVPPTTSPASFSP